MIDRDSYIHSHWSNWSKKIERLCASHRISFDRIVFMVDLRKAFFKGIKSETLMGIIKHEFSNDEQGAPIEAINNYIEAYKED